MINQRFRVDKIYAKSLEDNPLNAPVERELSIYLPPSYFKEENERYTTVYFLHGYSGNNNSLTVYPSLEEDPSLASMLSVAEIAQQLDVDQIPFYSTFDAFIAEGKIEPMIFIQPDGSLHHPNKYGLTTPTGDSVTKGSFYVNSPYTGNYEDYILEIIKYVDTNYRTKADRSHRLIAGVSMGGYGALSVGLRNLDLFQSIAALSPGTPAVDPFLDLKLRNPIYNMIMGADLAAKYGDALLGDILDTFDMIWSKENPLLPSVQRDESGKAVSYDTSAAENWNQGSLATLISQMHEQSPELMQTAKIYLSCEKNDEFHLAPFAEAIHQQLNQIGVNHHFDLSNNPKAQLSPHMFGCRYHILPAILYFLAS